MLSNMDTITEGSREGSVSTTESRKLSTREVEANAELEKLKRENEQLRATKTRTRIAPVLEESPRTLQAREQLEQLRLENERLLSSRLAPSAPPMSSRTYQNLNQSFERVQPDHEQSRGAGYPVIADYPPYEPYQPSLQNASRTVQNAVPNPPAGMSPRTVQAMEELNALKKENENLMSSKVAPSYASRTSPLQMPSSPPGSPQSLQAFGQKSIVPPRTVQASIDQKAPGSPQSIQAFGNQQSVLFRTVQAPEDQNAPVSPRTVQAFGPDQAPVSPRPVQAFGSEVPVSTGTVQALGDQQATVSPRTVQAFGSEAPVSPRTVQALGDQKATVSPRTVQGFGSEAPVSPRTVQALGDQKATVSPRTVQGFGSEAPASPRTVQALGDQKATVSPRTIQALEELNNLRQENEKLIASKVAPLPSGKSSRTVQNLGDQHTRISPRTVQALGELNVLKEENEKLIASKVAPPSPPGPYPSDKGVGDLNSRMSPRTVQALEEMNTIRRENEKLNASKVAAASPPPIEAENKENPVVDERPKDLSQQGSFSFRVPTVKASDEEEQSKGTKALPPMSARTLAQIRNDPAGVEVKTKSAPAVPSAGPDMSGRTLQVMDELAKLKKENELLKASKVATPVGMSDRTRQVMDQLEKVKRENAKLKSGKEEVSVTAQKRLAYLEQNHAAASKVRMLEIKKMILKGQELDLAFLVDATGSMQSSINMIKDTVTNMAEGIMEAYPECKLRVAFAPYRDYEDTARDDSEACDFTTSFSGADSTFARALARVRASGGGDDAEDVFTGMARVAGFNWTAMNRLVFHIADAPCHGKQFHDGVGDHYVNGDKYGRSIESQLQLLHQRCRISTYFFCHLNTSTRKMIQVFKKAAGDQMTIMEEQFKNISAIPHKVVTLARGTIQKTLSVVGAAHPVDMKYVNELVVTAIPSWSDTPIQTGSHVRFRRYRALDDLLSKINRKMALDEEAVDHVQVQIARNPFTAEGAVRWPYYAMITHPSEPSRFMVVKRFKTPLGKDIREVHKRDRYLAQMEVQAVAAQMAIEFNNRTSNFRNVKKVEFTQVTTLEVGSGSTTKYYNMEQVLEGEWIRYSNNGGYVNTSDYAAVLQAFTHWTHERSRGLLMVTDLQGVRIMNEDGDSVFCLCDPAIHCTDVMRFTRTNLGAEGFKLFFDTHKCNDVCKNLGLAVGTAGRTLSGTHVGSYW